jgi:hypothetical protein
MSPVRELAPVARPRAEARIRVREARTPVADDRTIAGTGQIDPHGSDLLPSAPTEPPPEDSLERTGVDVVKLVATLSPGVDQARSFEYVEVL